MKTRTKLSILFIILIAGGVCSKPADLAGRKRIPGTRISMEPPKGFKAATQFPGFMGKDPGVSIMVNAVPGAPFSQIAKGFDGQALATKGMKLNAKTEQKIDGKDGVLLSVSQSAYGQQFSKWLLVFGTERETTMIIASYPVSQRAQMEDLLKASVLTAKTAQGKTDFFEGVTFRVQESGPFKIANRMGNNLFLTEAGVFPQKKKGAPVIIVGSSATEGWAPPADKIAFAKERLFQAGPVIGPKVLTQKNVKIDNLDGILLTATGTDKNGTGPVYIEQCILFTKKGYYIFNALVADAIKQTYLADFNKILFSFKQKTIK